MKRSVPRSWVGRFLFFAAFVLLVETLPLLHAEETVSSVIDPCRNYTTSMLVVTSTHQLHLCEKGVSVDRWPVALGIGGIDKHVAGDHKTPLGAYPLGTPRPSQNFGTFIPVGYPTAEQRRRGFTGDAIGIHGPLRQYKDLGEVNIARDWTWGCIAVSSDGIIERIARWVRTHPDVNLHIATIPR